MSRSTLAPLLPLLLLVAACEPRNLELPPPPGAARISGRVVDAGGLGQAVTGARVALEGTSLAALSDGDGLFALAPVPAGRYVLSVTQVGPGTRALRRPLVLGEGQSSELGDLALADGGEVRGRALLAEVASGYAGTLVAIEGTRFQALTGDDGSFRIADVPVGPFRLVALREGYRSLNASGEVASGAVTLLRDLTLPRAPASPSTVSGTIVFSGDAGARAKTAQVKLFRLGGQPAIATVTTGRDGAFAFPAIAYGIYRVTAEGEGWRPAELDGIAVVDANVDVGQLALLPAPPADLDGDGLPDATDADRDGDGVEDANDLFPSDPHESADADHDGVGDREDEDDDDDGLTDIEELSLGRDEAITNPLVKDTDGDGHGDAEDTCPDVADPAQADADGDGRGDACDADPDGDGVPTFADNCPLAFNPGLTDLDGDGLGDACDPDLDGDGLANEQDHCPTIADATDADQDGDGKGDLCDEDLDGDGVVNVADTCVELANADQADLDADGRGDPCDDDDDGDTIPDATDTCPRVRNLLQTDTDHDGLGDACDPDMDDDGLANADDRCPLVADATNADLDADGVGDACDPDVDGDGVRNEFDRCPTTPDPDQADLDRDNLGDACDDDDDGDGVLDPADKCPHTPDPLQIDTDHDGVGDLCDADLDGDAVANAADDCPSVADADQADLDHDGEGDACDPDDDGDGIPDASDKCPRAVDPLQKDTDGDGVGDACDPDMDGDGIANASDDCPLNPDPAQADADHDGIGDACDPVVNGGAPKCTFGDKRCSPAMPAVETCDVSGNWIQSTVCAQACTNAACTNVAICTPGATRCNNLNVDTCNATGSAWVFTQACASGCADGLCTGACSPGAKRCNGLVPETCASDGLSWTAAAACANACYAGACSDVDLVVDGTTVTLEGDVQVTNSVTIRNGGKIRVGPSGVLKLKTKTFTIEAGGTLDANDVGDDSRGNGAGQAGICSCGYNCNAGWGGSAGSSYGSQGESTRVAASCSGGYAYVPAGPTYDRPDDLSISEGSRWGGTPGGGLVKIVADSITVDGTLTASATGQGASGGGILLAAEVVQGSGTIRAAGAPVSPTGGLGRVKLLSRSPTAAFTGTVVGVRNDSVMPPLDLASGSYPDPSRWYNDTVGDWVLSWSVPFPSRLGYYDKYSTIASFLPNQLSSPLLQTETYTVPATSLVPGANYFHVVSVGGGTGEIGTIRATIQALINATPPSISSSTHAQRTWDAATPANYDPRFAWANPLPDANFTGFYTAFDHFADTVPPQTPAAFTTNKSAIFPATPAGIWVLHVVNRDTRHAITKAAAHYVLYLGPNPGTGTLTGVVSDSAGPVAGATVQVNRGLFSTTTSSTGAYTFANNLPASSGFSPNTWEIRVQKAGYQDATDVVTITAGQASTLNLTLAK